MRKFSRLMAIMFLCVASFLLSTACGAKIEKGVVKSGTLETTVVKGSVVDTSNVVVYYTYSNDEVITVSASELEFSSVDTSQVTENAKLTITYDGFSFDVTIRVRASEDDVNDISEFTSLSQNVLNDNITTNAIGFYNHAYDASKDVEAGAEDKYLGTESFRYVGTDNPFVMDLQIAGYDANDEVVDTLANVSTKIKVELINDDGSRTELTETSTPKLSDMVSVSSVDATFDFTESAEYKAFFVTIEPKNKMPGVQTAMTVKAELHVIPGFNVHDAKELSVYDNSGRDYDSDGTPDWNDIKQSVNIPVDYVPETIILQNDINITNNDVPRTMFWHNEDIIFRHTDEGEGVLSTFYNNAKELVKGKDEKGNDLTLEGSMVDRDFTGVYHYDFKTTGSTINMIGNYFTITCKDLARAVVEGRGNKGVGVSTIKGAQTYMEMHSTLFCHTYMMDDDAPGTNSPYAMTEDCQINWKNINFTGNGGVSDEAQYSGSIILFKTYRVNADIYNCVSTNFAINYLFAFGENSCDIDGQYRLDYCKGSSAYQALVFSNGGEHVTISNSKFVGACGPAIISTLHDSDDYTRFMEREAAYLTEYNKGADADPDTLAQLKAERDRYQDEYHVSRINIVASYIESMVSGEEPWFKYHQANTYISMLTGIEAFLDGSAFGAPKGVNIGKTMFNEYEGKQLFNLQVLAMSSFDVNNFFAPGVNAGYVRFFGNYFDTEEKPFEESWAETYADDWNNFVNFNEEENYEDGLVVDGEISGYPISNGLGVVIEDDNGSWLNAEVADNQKASSDVVSALMSLIGGNPSLYKELFKDSSWLDFYIINGLACRTQLYPRG